MALQKAQKSGAMTTNFKFQAKGDTLKGYYQGQVTKTINGSPAVEHTYKTSNGLVSVLGQANILTQYKNNNITPGTYVEITFSGQMQKLKGGRTMKVYDVAFDTDDQDSDASAPSAESEAEYADEELSSEEETSYYGERPPSPVLTAPRTPAQPSLANQAKVQGLLGGRNKS